MKYISEIEDEPFVCKSALHGEEAHYRAKGFKSLVFDKNGLDKLAPYNKDKAYTQGYTDQYKKDAGAIKLLTESREVAYQKGLDDAWEAARRISVDKADGGFSTSELSEIFAEVLISKIIKNYTPNSVIDRIRKYEEKQRQEQDGLRQNIQTIIDQCGYSLGEIEEVVRMMKEGEE